MLKESGICTYGGHNESIDWIVHQRLASCTLSLCVFFFLVTCRSAPSGAYYIRIGDKAHLVYCKMENTTCGEGGWVLVMKINGSKVRTCFRVQSVLIPLKAIPLTIVVWNGNLKLPVSRSGTWLRATISGYRRPKDRDTYFGTKMSKLQWGLCRWWLQTFCKFKCFSTSMSIDFILLLF